MITKIFPYTLITICVVLGMKNKEKYGKNI